MVRTAKGGARVECYAGQKRDASGLSEIYGSYFGPLSNSSIVTVVDSFLTT